MILPNNTVIITCVITVLVVGTLFYLFKRYYDKKISQSMKDMRKKIMRDINKLNEVYNTGDMPDRPDRPDRQDRSNNRRYKDDDSVIEAGGLENREYADADCDSDSDE
jgi:hypothetical protein